jgi:hypothetical protein
MLFHALKVACLFDILVLNNKVKPAMTMRGGHIGVHDKFIINLLFFESQGTGTEGFEEVYTSGCLGPKHLPRGGYPD